MHEFGSPAFFGKAMENVCWACAGSGQASASRSWIAAQDSSVMTICRVVVFTDVLPFASRSGGVSCLRNTRRPTARRLLDFGPTGAAPCRALATPARAPSSTQRLPRARQPVESSLHGVDVGEVVADVVLAAVLATGQPKLVSCVGIARPGSAQVN